MNTRESCVNHPRGASSPPTHRPQPTNLSCAEKAAAADDGGGGGGAAAIHACISTRLMEQYRTYISYII